MGIKTVAVYSTADADSLHVKFADEAVCIGAPMSKDSYLSISRIMSAIEITNADAVHPGYGFLSENSEFSEICSLSGVKFIGPTPLMIKKMGDKNSAKETMKQAGVPTIPGSDGLVESVKEAVEIGQKIGYPIIIKATAGGGGKGMRVVKEVNETANAFESARIEAEKAFGNNGVYIEKFLEEPRHIEIQILGDQYGKAIDFGERDCTIQRRHQKLIEESPSPILSSELRKKMGEAGIMAAHAISYEGAGTIEFLVDKHKKFLLYGNEYTYSGHSIECRINAEDPDKDFRPSPGILEVFHTPGGPGVRVETHAYAGYIIPPTYDSMIAKLIVHAENREHATERMLRALDEFVVIGIKTTIPFHKKVLKSEEFRSGIYDTSFIEKVKL
ncbi:hypothetical protein CHS0354_000622 [Potamilus streckersoni]|uniref:Biotin carboxylase n=1 Tax=Potamilus streckersoni TaxID=2493646 RepID=A0AAE0T857_9BIVA|nr:hypothetical protein CHS0354_000622 [Potamilus streckersoni]